MKLELYRTNDGQTISNSSLFRVKTDTLQYAEWLEKDFSENRISRIEDGLWDMWNIYSDENGKLYVAEKTWLDPHFGEWAMWAEVEPIATETNAPAAVNEYNYEELEAAATKFGATQEEIDALGEWFERFGRRYWNGECYEVSEKEGLYLYPMHKQVGEDEFEIVGWSFSSADLFVEG